MPIPTARVTIPIRIFPKIDRGKAVASILIDSTEIRARVMRAEIVRRATVGIDTATLTVANINDEYSGAWEKGDSAEIKMDFSDGSTTVFKGYISKITDIFDRFPQLEICCSGYGIEAFKNPVFEKYTTATDIGQIFADMVAKYLPSHTTTGVDTATGVTASPMWQGKDLFYCLQDLAMTYGLNNYDFFVSAAKDWSFFKKGSKAHGPDSGIAIVYGQNHRRTRLEDPLMAKSNKITVIGKSLKGQMIMATAQDTDDQSEYWKMGEIIRDDNLTTLAQVKAMAAYLKEIKVNTGRSGTVLSDGMPGMLPGYNVMMYDPNNKIDGFVVVSEATHRVTSEFTTESKINEELPKDLPLLSFMKKSREDEQKSLGLENEHGMENSFPIFFDNSDQIDGDLTDYNVEAVNGRLVLTSGTSGTFVSVMETAASNITQGVLVIVGSDYEDSVFEVSIDNGSNYVAATPRSLTSFSGNDKRIRIRTTLQTTSARKNPSIESAGFLYR